MSNYIEWGKLAKIVELGLAIGAGLPALFAVAVRSLAGPGARDDAGRRVPLRVAIAAGSFAIVLAAIASAIILIGRHGR